MNQVISGSQSHDSGELKERPEKAKMIRSDIDEPCFFCGKTPSNECAVPIQVCKLVDKVGSDRAQKILGALLGGVGGLLSGFVTRGQTAVFKKRYVMVPRCLGCKQVHDKTNEREGYFILSALVGGVILAIYFWFSKVVGNAPLWLQILALLALAFAFGTAGFIFGSILGFIYRIFESTSGIKPESHGQKYHIVREMVDNGWNCGRRPNTSATNFIELPVEKEESYGTSDKI